MKDTPNLNDLIRDRELLSRAPTPHWLPSQDPLATWGPGARKPLRSLLVPGVYFPALTSLLSRKVRESERAFTYSAVGAGSQFG